MTDDAADVADYLDYEWEGPLLAERPDPSGGKKLLGKRMLTYTPNGKG